MKKNEIKRCGCCRLSWVDYSRTAEKSWLSAPQRPDWSSEPIWIPESREVVQGWVRSMEGDPGGGEWGGRTGGAADCSSKPNTNPTLRSCMGRRLHFSTLKLSFKTPTTSVQEDKKVPSKLHSCKNVN